MEQNVEDGDHNISYGQVDQEVVGHRPHSLMSKDNPDDDDVPPCGHDEHQNKHGIEYKLLPPRQKVLWRFCCSLSLDDVAVVCPLAFYKVCAAEVAGVEDLVEDDAAW